MTTDIFLEQEINILIVDDNRYTLKTLTLALEEAGRQIFTTTDPKEVVQICIQQNISIVLLDVIMPDLNGLDLLDLLKNNPLTEHILVIMITGQDLSSDETVAGLSKGAVDFLSKPLDLYITQAKINSLITMINYQRAIQEQNNAIQQQNKELEKSKEELSIAIARAEKSKSVKEAFLANMSHEIRTPLTAITGLTHLIKHAETSDDKAHAINLLEYSTKSLLGLVNDILDSEKIDAGKIKISRSNTDIRKLIRNCSDLLRPLAEKKGIRLESYIEEDVPPIVMTDPLRFNQIMMNLINNAIKFTETGQIDVTVTVMEVAENMAKLQVAVHDTGMGIPEASKSKIFERFEQVDDKRWQKMGGSGLGLSIVKKLIELKGGTLTLDSEVGKGTTFKFSNWYQLPALQVDNKEASSAVGLTSARLERFENVSILLAEDDAMNQLVTSKILTKWGVKVDVAENGEEAYNKLSNNDYDLILMDAHMPIMDGYAAARKIRSELIGKKRDIPIISFSASVMEQDHLEALDAGMNSYIMKPFDLAELHGKISGYVKVERT